MPFAPAYRAVGAASPGLTSAVTVAAPTGVVPGDLEILIATTIAGGSISITTAGGSAWTALSNSPIDVTAGEKLYCWWRIMQSGDTSPQVTATSDHVQAGRVAVVGGSFDPTTPIEIAVSGSETTSDTSFSFAPGNSTTLTNSLLFVICSSGVDSGTGQAGTDTANANLAGIVMRAEYQTTNGGGGGFWFATGTLATPGAVGTWTQTMTAASPKAYLSFAVRPYVAASPTATGALDTFNAGASQNLTSRTGWATAALIFSGYTTLATDSTPTYAASAGTGSNYWGSTFGADVEVWTTFGSVRTVYWLYTRMDVPPSPANYYEFEVDTTSFKITKNVAASTTILRSVTHGLTLATGDSVMMRSVGAFHEIWYKASGGSWVFQWAVYDASLSGASKYIGIAQSATNRVDEFGGGDVVTAAARPRQYSPTRPGRVAGSGA